MLLLVPCSHTLPHFGAASRLAFWLLRLQMLTPSSLPADLPLHGCSLLRRLWPRMHTRYLHVLRLDPDRLDAVRLDRLWKKMSDQEAAGVQGGWGGAKCEKQQQQQQQQSAARSGTN